MGMEEFEREVFLSRDLIAAEGRYAVERSHRCVTGGVRVRRGVQPDIGHLATAMLRLYPESTLCGWTAARLHGHTMAGSRTLVEVMGPRQIRRRGVICRMAALEPSEIVVDGALRYTSAVRTAIDLARYTPGDEAIAAMDQCLRVHGRPATATPPAWVRRPAMTTRAAIERELDRREWWRGTRVRAVLDEADGRAESPWESFARLTLHRVGLVTMVPQVPVFDGAYYLDLADPELKVAVEYDGAHHRSAQQHAHDAEKWNALQADGWRLIIVTAGPLAHRPDVLIRRVRAAMAERDGRATA
ncbi:hypothetical protein GCM10009551_039090 [Nocardiopsis tropica]